MLICFFLITLITFIIEINLIEITIIDYSANSLQIRGFAKGEEYSRARNALHYLRLHVPFARIRARRRAVLLVISVRPRRIIFIARATST